MLLQVVADGGDRVVYSRDCVVDLGNLLAQVATRRLNSLVYRSRAIAIYKVDLLGELLTKVAFEDLALNDLKHLRWVIRGCGGDIQEVTLPVRVGRTHVVEVLLGKCQTCVGEGKPLPQIHCVGDRRLGIGRMEVLVGPAVQAVLAVDRYQGDAVHRREIIAALWHGRAAHVDVDARLAGSGTRAEGNDAHGIGAGGQAIDIAACGLSANFERLHDVSALADRHGVAQHGLSRRHPTERALDDFCHAAGSPHQAGDSRQAAHGQIDEPQRVIGLAHSIIKDGLLVGLEGHLAGIGSAHGPLRDQELAKNVQ
ncbi:hypothetical protein D3C80_1181570 [compost metagenome]